MTSTFKQRLASGETVVTVNVGGRNADLVAPLARAGADAAFIDCERSGIALDAAAELLFAARAAGLCSLVRPHSAHPSEVVRFIDRGADGLVIPHCDSAEDAQAAVDLLRYACGRGAADKVLIVQIETRKAVADLARIAAVPGIDAFLIGPNDLAWEVCGERGAKNPEMTRIVDGICSDLAAAGRRYGMPAPPRELADVRRRGCSFLYYAADWLIEAGMRDLRQRLQD